MEYVASGDVSSEGVHMLSTSGMLQHVEQNPEGSFIVATETGMLYPLEQAAPQADLIAANRMAFCKYMKMITLPKLRDSLRDMSGEVRVPPDIAAKAKDPDRAHGRNRLTAPGGRCRRHRPAQRAWARFADLFLRPRASRPRQSADGRPGPRLGVIALGHFAGLS